MTEPWSQAHEEARRRGEPAYVDPATGLLVFTERYHQARGWCCGSGCRHCPWADDLEEEPQGPPPPFTLEP